MSQTRRRPSLSFLLTLATASGPALALGQYEAPASYYASITTQTGTALKTQLAAIMTNGHIQTSYAQARDFLPFTDANPDDLTQMFEFYTHNVIQKPSAGHIGFVGLYQSREHVWPDSLQGPGDTSNSTRGSRGDIHMLKPLSQSVNSSRGNHAYGGATLTGSARNIGGGLWFPGTSDKGDAARIIFYGATRWGSTLSVVNGTPTSNTQMGDLAALLRFHYQDVPDLFELRRNDTIYRGDDVRTPGDDSSFGGTNNRNAFIDRPEYVWSVFVDQANDTRLSIGTPDVNGGSTATVDLGRVLRNAPVPAAQNVTLNKAGVDGTYYSVTTSGAATSTVTGRYNAFPMDSTGSRTIGIGLDTSTTTAGLKLGTVTVDNLDVTTQGGLGRGANDVDDIVTVRLAVLAPSNPSFVQTSDVKSAQIDFGTYALGTDAATAVSIPLFNLASPLGSDLTAGLDFDGVVVAAGSSSAINVSVTPFSALAAGAHRDIAVSLQTDNVGLFDASFMFSLSDEDLPGVQTASTLELAAMGRVAIGGDTNYDNLVDFTDLLTLAQHFGQIAAATWIQGDFDRDGDVSFTDLLTLAQNYNGSAAIFEQDWALARSMLPEPTTAIVLVATLSALRLRRRHR